MKPELKRISICSLCLIITGGLFFLGIIIGRHWEASRIEPKEKIGIDEIVVSSDDEKRLLKIDIKELNFVEELRRNEAHDENQDSYPRNVATARLDSDSSPLFIQLGVYKKYSNAAKAFTQHRKQRLPVKIVQKKDSKNVPLYRVLIGPFKNRSDASVIISRLDRKKIDYFIKYASAE